MGRKVLHLDAFSGAAGNMFMGALLDLGMSRKALLSALELLGLDFKLVVKKVQRSGFAACYVDVKVPVDRCGFSIPVRRGIIALFPSDIRSVNGE